MKITLSTGVQDEKPETLRLLIKDKLNKLVNSSDFFTCEGEYFLSRRCSNVGVHNSVVILMALFADSHHRQFDSFTAFSTSGHQAGTEFNIPDKLLPKLKKVLDTISCVDDIKISLE